MNFRLYLDRGEVLIFSSKCTGVGGWDEVGSLSIALELKREEPIPSAFIKTDIDHIHVANYSMLVFERGDVYSEAGICFSSDSGERVIIAAAAVTGAVSVYLPKASQEFKPEFPIDEYEWAGKMS